MYSRYRYKSRQYNRKKKINQKFSPAAYKNNVPTYYQQKGRIIQTSPRIMYEYPTEVVTKKKLDQMYDALFKAHYPGVGISGVKITPDIILQYNISNVPIMEIFQFEQADSATSIPIGQSFCDYILTTIPNIPEPAPGYKWGAGLMSILYDYPDTQLNVSQFHLDYVNNWLSNNQLQMIIKSLSTNAGSNGYNGIIFFSPMTHLSARWARINFTSGAMSNSLMNAGTISELNTNTDFISIISSTETNYLEITRDLTQADINVPGLVSLSFAIYQYPI